MNILPKKRWHVRTKENMQRVRRDEAKAAAEEKAKMERVTLAENEDRVRRMKMRRDVGETRSGESMVGTSSGQNPTSQYGLDFFGRAIDVGNSHSDSGQEGPSREQPSQHVNLFAELEAEERKNLATGNKEYEAEKKKERDEWESKMGIMKRFAEDTKEFSKEQYWWEKIPMIRESEGPSLTASASHNTEPKRPKPTVEANTKRLSKTESTIPTPQNSHSHRDHSFEHVEKKRRRHEEKDSRHKHRHHHKVEKTEESVVETPKTKLERLRAERLQRERIESQRARNFLLASSSAIGVKKEGRESGEESLRQRLEKERSSGYNTQFNPEFAKPRRSGGEGGW